MPTVLSHTYTGLEGVAVNPWKRSLLGTRLYADIMSELFRPTYRRNFRRAR